MNAPVERARRRIAIVEHFNQFGAPATIEKFKISRQRLYKIIEFQTQVAKPKRQPKT
jgi:hypothetical protein